MKCSCHVPGASTINHSLSGKSILWARGNILQSDEDRLKLKELMPLCTTLQNRVLDLEKTKTTQANEIASLKRRVKTLKKKNRINVIDADEEITLVSVQDDADKEMFEVDALNCEKVFVAGQNENVFEEVVDTAQVSAAATTVTITTEEITLAQALKALKTSKPKVKGIVFQEPGKSTTITTISSQQSHDKGKRILIEPMEPMKKKDLIKLNEEVALKLQAEFDEEERLTREKVEKVQEANIALIETWDDIQAMIDADHQLVERLQAQEQEELSVKEKATLFQQLLEKIRKHFAAKRAEEKRNKPPTKAKRRKIMYTCLKNMEGYKHNDLKLKDFDSIQEKFDRAFKRVNTFEDFRTELVKGKAKRAGTELAQEITKKQKVKDEKETTKIKKLMEIIPDEEEVAINAISLAVKSPRKILKLCTSCMEESTRLQIVELEAVRLLWSTFLEDATCADLYVGKEESSDPSDNVADEVVHKELGDSLVRDATTTYSSLGTTSGGGSRCQETIGDTIAQTRVLDLEKTKTTQANEIASLKRRVKKLEKKNRSRTHKLKRLYKVGLIARVESSGDEASLGKDASKQGRINAIDADEEITLVSVQDDADKEMFDVDALNGEEVFVAGQNENVVEEVVDAAQVSTAATTVTITTKEITLAQALKALKTSKPKVKGIVFQEPGKSTTTTTISSQQSQDKGKGILIEPVEPMKKKDLIRLDEEVALKLQAEFDKEERLARETAEKEQEANIALIET
ncbi:hypothetical protein Tco_0391138 [Tanacetum coccineum]